jgi:eukaryotic-like serine/threonine-protein kinase
LNETPPKDDPDAQLVLTVLDSDEFDASAPPDGPPELVGELVRVRAIMQAFDSLGVAAPVTPPPIPSWGPFTLREQVGHGRFGTVCRAFDPAVQREVAVKLYAGKDLPSEPRLMARVRHPNVVTVFGAAVHEGRPGIWMEFIHGQTLGHRVQTDGPLAPDEVLRIGIALCDALAAVHAAQLIHQDIKPRNVIQEDSGRVVLMDFGAGLPRDDGAIDRVSGTPVFMAPEVVLGARPSVESDVYSLGVLLYYLLTGTYPVYAPNLDELRRLHERHHRTGTRRFVATLHELRPEVSPALARCLAKALAPTGQRYKTAADFETALETVRLGVWERPRQRLRFWAAAILMLVIGAGAGLWINRPQPHPTVTLKRLTWDDGLTTDPTSSRDGKLLAYASDRGGEGNLDIWVQQMSGGQPLRLTKDPADDSEPNFSPDGDQIVFRSERDGGGVYVVSTLGGEPQLLAREGRCPRFSPDGRWIAYLSGTGGASLFLISSSGGTPRQLRGLPPGAASQAAPIWSPDSRHILILHQTAPEEPAQGNQSWDWWVVAVAGDSPAIRTGAVSPHVRPFIDSLPTPWTWVDSRILYSAQVGDATNLWSVDISPDSFHVHGRPQRLTISSDNETQPSLSADGRVLFSTRSARQGLWQLDLDTNQGQPVSRPRALTNDLAVHGFHSLSDDGRYLAFSSSHLGNLDIWLRDMRTGTETALTSTPWAEDLPVFQRDGTRVLYQRTDKDRQSVYSIQRTGGLPERVCDNCEFATDLSPDGKTVLLQHALTGHSTLEALDVDSGARHEILRHDQYALYRGHFSADGRWVTFHAADLGGGSREFVAPFRKLSLIEVREWIPITDGQGAPDVPRWSPDGTLLYYVSDRDGSRCIWAQRLVPETKRPIGEPFAVFHSHDREHSLSNVAVGGIDLAVARDKIIFNMGELKGNIWSAEFH